MPADVIKVGPLGPYDNNAYIIVDGATKKSIFVDAPIGSEAAIEAARATDVQMIIVTHRHGDHTSGLHHVLKVNPGVKIASISAEKIAPLTS